MSTEKKITPADPKTVPAAADQTDGRDKDEPTTAAKDREEYTVDRNTASFRCT